jgi:hypothetical protein
MEAALRNELSSRLEVLGIRTQPTWNYGWLKRLVTLTKEERESEISKAILMLEKVVDDVSNKRNCRPGFIWDSMPMTKELVKLKEDFDKLSNDEAWERYDEVTKKYEELVAAYLER